MLDGDENENNSDYQSFAAGASFVPLVMVIFFAATTKMVSCSLTPLHLWTYYTHSLSCFANRSLLLLLETQVELSLGIGIFVGSCMVAGSIVAGFRDMLDVYLLDALADKDHAYVFLFILFMAGLVGLIEKSGGLKGITKALRSRYHHLL